MDDLHFDRLTRRLVVGGLTAALGLGTARVPDDANAGKGMQRKKKVKRNEFGCVNVGRFCKNGGQCCSGICQGKKGKKKCKAHDSGVGCRAGDRTVSCSGSANTSCTASTNLIGLCETTTGNAGYCSVRRACFACKKDKECQDLCGEAAVCIRCAADCSDTEGTACANPTIAACPV